MTSTHNDTDDAMGDDDLIALYGECGFDPAETDLTAIPDWLAARYEAVQRHESDGWLVAFTPDPEAELTLQVLTRSGVIRSEARFDMTALGHRMFAAAVEALRS